MFNLIITSDLKISNKKVWARTEFDPSSPNLVITLRLMNRVQVGYAIVGYSKTTRICECEFVFVNRLFAVKLVRKVREYVGGQGMHIMTATISASPLIKFILHAGGLTQVVSLEDYAILNRRPVAMLIYES